MIEKNGKIWTSKELLAAYTQPIHPESKAMNEQLNQLVYKINSSLVNTFGILPNPRDMDISSITEQGRTYLVIKPTEEFKDKLRSMTFEETVKYLRDSRYEPI